MSPAFIADILIMDAYATACFGFFFYLFIYFFFWFISI